MAVALEVPARLARVRSHVPGTPDAACAHIGDDGGNPQCEHSRGISPVELSQRTRIDWRELAFKERKKRLVRARRHHDREGPVH